MSDLRTHPCPSCDGQIPNNERPGAYMGAISRKDNKTEICSACGTREALLPLIISQRNEMAQQLAKIDSVLGLSVDCPQCERPTSPEAIAQWEMCHDCDNQMCAECGQIDCEHEF
jgi:hypothetical protein